MLGLNVCSRASCSFSARCPALPPRRLIRLWTALISGCGANCSSFCQQLLQHNASVSGAPLGFRRHPDPAASSTQGSETEPCWWDHPQKSWNKLCFLLLKSCKCSKMDLLFQAPSPHIWGFFFRFQPVSFSVTVVLKMRYSDNQDTEIPQNKVIMIKPELS